MMKGMNFKLSATNAAAPAFASFNRGMEAVRRTTASTQPVMRSWNAGLNSNRRAVQQFGFQMSDFAIQVSGGQSAVLAFIQQGGQMLQFFGPAGAILASLVAVFGSLYLGITRAGLAMEDMYPYLGTLQDEFRGVVAVMGNLIDMAAKMGKFIVRNLDVIIIALAITVGWFAVKWVAAMVISTVTTGAFANVLRATAFSFYAAGAGAAAATLATSAWTGALALLRTAMLRLGLPALIILTAYLVERFLTLVRGAGSFGAALGLLADVAKDAFHRIYARMVIMVLGLKKGWLGMKQSFFQALIPMAQKFDEFVDNTVIKWNQLFGKFDSLKLSVGWSVADQLREQANAIGIEVDGINDSIGSLREMLDKPWTSLDALRDALKAGETGPLPDFDFSKKGKDKKSKSPVDKAKEQADKIKKTFEDVAKSISTSMLSAFKGLLDGSKSFGDAARDILGNILDNIIDLLMTPIFNSIAGSVAGGIQGALTGGLGLGNLLSFDGGGDTWSGPRAGGLDGKGGRLAMLHSNETVTDHTKGGGGGGGDTYNMTWNIQSPDVEGIRKSKSQIKAEFALAVQSGGRGN